MRVLYLSHRFPYPPTFGSKVRAFNTIAHLARAGHEVTVVAPVRSAQEAAEAAGIAAHCHAFHAPRVQSWAQTLKMLATLPTGMTASEAYFHSGAMQALVRRLLDARSADVLIAHCSSIGRVAEHVQGLPKLIDYCDVDSRKWLDYTAYKRWPLSIGYRWEGWRLAAAERRIAAGFDRVTVATQGEVEALRDVGVSDRVDWFANGVDTAYFAPAAEPFDARCLTFVGRMDYFPNEQCMVEFCARIWPRLRARDAGLRLQIVGAAPTAAVLALGALPGVEVTGAVPDVRPYVQRSALTIAPLAIARGTQNKILESMAMGVPALCSPIAAAGVDAESGEHLLVAHSEDEWVERVLEVCADARLRARLAEAGRARVLSHHTWPQVMRRFDRILGECLSARPAATALPAIADA